MAQKKKNDLPATPQAETPIEVAQSPSVPQTTNPARDEYLNLLQTYHSDNSLTEEKLHQNILEEYEREYRNTRQRTEELAKSGKILVTEFDSYFEREALTKAVEQFALAKKYDRQVTEQALKSRKSPDDVIEAISQGIYARHLSESDNGEQKVAEYLKELKNSYSERLNSPETSQNREENTEPDLLSESSKEVESSVTPKSEAIPTEKSKKEAEDYALSLVQFLGQRRLNVERLRIDINGQTVFKMSDAEVDQSRTRITDEHAELIKKALNDPAAFDGSLRITQGSQVLVHVKDGRVLIDDVGLTKQSVKAEIKTPSPQVKTEPDKTPDSPSKGLYELYSKDVKSQGLQATHDIISNALKNGMEPEQIKQMLKEQDPGYQKLLQGEQGEKLADKTLDKAIALEKAKIDGEKMPTQQQSKEVETSKSLSR